MCIRDSHQPDQQPRVRPTSRGPRREPESNCGTDLAPEPLGLWGLQEPKKAQGAPGARNGQFAKENVREKQHFGDRLQKLGFWGLQQPNKAQGAPGARNCQFAN